MNFKLWLETTKQTDAYIDPDDLYGDNRSITFIYDSEGHIVYEKGKNTTHWELLQKNPEIAQRYEDAGITIQDYYIHRHDGSTNDLHGRLAPDPQDEEIKVVSFWGKNKELFSKLLLPCLERLQKDGYIDMSNDLVSTVNTGTIHIRDLFLNKIKDANPEDIKRQKEIQNMHIMRGNAKKLALKQIGYKGSKNPWQTAARDAGITVPAQKLWALNSESRSFKTWLQEVAMLNRSGSGVGNFNDRDDWDGRDDDNDDEQWGSKIEKWTNSNSPCLRRVMNLLIEKLFNSENNYQPQKKTVSPHSYVIENGIRTSTVVYIECSWILVLNREDLLDELRGILSRGCDLLDDATGSQRWKILNNEQVLTTILKLVYHTAKFQKLITDNASMSVAHLKDILTNDAKRWYIHDYYSNNDGSHLTPDKVKIVKENIQSIHDLSGDNLYTNGYLILGLTK